MIDLSRLHTDKQLQYWLGKAELELSNIEGLLADWKSGKVSDETYKTSAVILLKKFHRAQQQVAWIIEEIITEES